MCEVNGDPPESRKFDSQNIQTSISPTCKTDKAQQIKTDNAVVNYANVNMPDCVRSSINSTADKRTCLVLTNKIHNKFNIVFFLRIGCFEGTFSLQVKNGSEQWSLPGASTGVVYAL